MTVQLHIRHSPIHARGWQERAREMVLTQWDCKRFELVHDPLNLYRPGLARFGLEELRDLCPGTVLWDRQEQCQVVIGREKSSERGHYSPRRWRAGEAR